MPKTAQKDASVATVKKQGAAMKHIKKYWQWYAMMFIPIVYYIVFRYIPMFGNIIAFRRYRAGGSIFGDEWSGLKYFNQFMKDQNFWRAFKNTLLLNFKYLIISFPLTLIFALLLNEVKNVHFKKIVQTISYLPHFISMVIVAGMVREILSTSGPINNLITKLGGEAITFISLPEWFTTIFVTTGVWQGLGWGTILYLAAMSGINTELYEAAELDGANRFQRCLHVTIPAIPRYLRTINSKPGAAPCCYVRLPPAVASLSQGQSVSKQITCLRCRCRCTYQRCSACSGLRPQQRRYPNRC